MDEENLSQFTPTTKLKRAKFKSRIKRKVVEEILKTEENYVSNLKILIKYFVDPILENSILNPKEAKIIFGEIYSILRINEEFLRHLKNESDISMAFLKLIPYFKQYSYYATNFETANAFLQNLLKTRPRFAEFIKCQESSAEVQMTLSSILIQPIQRIPRYKLLLQELLKITHQNENVKNALVQVEVITEEMNNQLHIGDNIRRMLEIQKKLVNNQPKIIVPGRRLIKEGLLHKISEKSGRILTRQFFLFNDMLMYCKQQKRRFWKMQSNGRLWLCHCILPIRHCYVSPTGGDGDRQRFYFKVVCYEMELNLFDDNYNDGKHWVEAIATASAEFVRNRKTLRKMSTIYNVFDKTHLRTPRNQCSLGIMALSPISKSPHHPFTCSSIDIC